jgi:hypothetical protein
MSLEALLRGAMIAVPVVLAACAQSTTGGTVAETKRAEDRRVFKEAMTDLDELRSLAAMGCGHPQIGDVRQGIGYLVERESTLKMTTNEEDLERVRRYLWSLQFGLLDEAVERRCHKVVEELQAALLQEYKEAILGNPEAKANPPIETIREAMDL